MSSLFRRGGAKLAKILESILDPAAGLNQVQLYAKEAAGVTQLFARASDGTITQLTPVAGGGAPVGLLGDGSDGALNFNGVATPVAGATLVGSTYTMTRSIFATSITVAAGVTVKGNGWRVFCTGTITGPGTFSVAGGNGGNGTNGFVGVPGAAGVAGGATNELFAGAIGGTGGGTGGGFGGSAGGSATAPFGFTAGTVAGTVGAGASGGVGQGGAGTGNGANTGGSGGTIALMPTASGNTSMRALWSAITGKAMNGSAYTGGSGGGGSAGGANPGTPSGGGGGGGGGCFAVLAREFAGGITITAAGGAGGSGGPTGGPADGPVGGASGGGGGVLVIAWIDGAAPTYSVAGGAAGAGSLGGVNGGAGGAGLAHLFPLAA